MGLFRGQKCLSEDVSVDHLQGPFSEKLQLIGKNWAQIQSVTGVSKPLQFNPTVSAATTIHLLRGWNEVLADTQEAPFLQKMAFLCILVICYLYIL